MRPSKHQTIMGGRLDTHNCAFWATSAQILGRHPVNFLGGVAVRTQSRLGGPMEESHESHFSSHAVSLARPRITARRKLSNPPKRLIFC